jgi:hypothetical protein
MTATRSARVARADFSTGWMRNSLCTEAPGLPWTEDHQVPSYSSDLMRYLCQHCPVSVECTVFTRDAGVSAGFWAGASRNPVHDPGEAA